MKRRDFVKSTALAGVTAVAQGCVSAQMGSRALRKPENTGDGFDVHPFIKNNPGAVFIHLTDVDEKTNSQAMGSIGKQLSRELIVRQNGGYPMSTKVTVKPNWTSAGPKDGKPVVEKLGVNTDPFFVEGFVQGMKSLGPEDFYIRECCCPDQWEPMGYAAMCERNDIDLRNLSKIPAWDLEPGKDLNWIEIPDPVVTRRVAYMAPMNEPGSFLVNIAKMKSHGMGITAAIKNLQGIAGHRFHQMCTPVQQITKNYEKYYHKHFVKNHVELVTQNYERHLAEGYPRWDRKEPINRNGLWMECWCQRILDTLSVTPTALNIVEGIYSQDGNGFGRGPYEKLGPNGVTSRDYMSNINIFGIDPVRVDIITHWLSGHEPGNFGLFHIAMERGLSDILDPHDIPIYLWKDGKAQKAELDSFERTPLVTYYLQRNYDGQKEPEYHLCDEPFDYGAWKKGASLHDCTPNFQVLGKDADGKMVGQITVPENDDVYVDVLDRNGEIQARLRAPDLEPGVHQVVWDGFCSPGLHNYYVKGMGWDDKLKEVIV